MLDSQMREVRRRATRHSGKKKMSSQDNPFGATGSYQVSYGAPQDAGPPEVAGAAPIKDVTTASFATDVIQESRRQPVLVDFWAPWCGPCKQLQPALERVVQAARGRVKLVKMNIDDHPSVAGQLGIQSIPAVIAFKDGRPVDGFMGAVPETQIREFIERVAGKGAGPDLDEVLKAAGEARAAGDLQQAAGLYDAVLSQQPDQVDAIAALADILFETGDVEAARELLATAPPEKQDAPAVAAVRTRMTLAEEAAKLGDPVALELRLADNPKDHQARFDLAMIRNALGEREQAADLLLDIVKADRTWQDDGARNQLLKFFEAWGMTDPATLSARRRLSSLLFA